MCDFGENRIFAHPILYIYIYSSYFRIFLENSAILPKEAGIMTENKVFTCVFLQNASNTRRISGNSCVFMYVSCETRYFRLFLQKSPCSATITGNLCVISWRNRPRIPATDAKISPLPVIYPPPHGYAARLAVWRSFLIFDKNFCIIYIQSKEKINFLTMKLNDKKEKNHYA